MRVVWLVAAWWSTLAAAQQLEVETEHGPVRGRYHPDTDLRAFLALPYGAVDPSDRFGAPRPPANWSSVLEADEFNTTCLQWDQGGAVAEGGSEDCLVLNVFAPGEGADLPVLFHVHGGELQRGSASPAAYGAERLVRRGVVLVAPNYRLGPLGFLCLRDAAAPGNAGLKDLRLALQWVHRNIHQFGGDPARVTVSGEGTGGGAAGFLALAPSTAHLVDKLIAESGSPLSPWILDRAPVDRARNFLRALADEYLEVYDYENATQLLRELNASSIVSKARERDDRFRVCVESAYNNSEIFLPAPPYHLLLALNSSVATAMLGYASGAGMREAAAQTAETMATIEENHYALLPADLAFPSSTSRFEAAESIKRQYFGDEPISIEKREEYMQYYTDATYLGPTLRTARLLARDSRVFLYEFGYDGALNFEKRALEVQSSGAARRDLAGYVFRRDDEPDPLSEEDLRVVTVIGDLWISFIVNGTPHMESWEAASVQWEPLSEEAEQLLNITEFPPTPQQGAHADRMQLWDNLYAFNYIDCPSDAQRHAAPCALALLSLLVFVRRTSLF